MNKQLDELLSKEFLDEKEIRFANFLMLKEMYKSKETEKELAVYKKALGKIKEQFNYEVKNNFAFSPNSVDYINMYIPDIENFLDNVLDQTRKELGENSD